MRYTGISLIVTGSGIYWILSSQLIGSFTVLMPNMFGQSGSGNTLIMIVGILFSAIGLGTINHDMHEALQLFERQDGWVFTLPILLASMDILVTTIGLATAQTRELNPLIASALAAGGISIGAFFVSYVILAEGLALLMLNLGKALFGTDSVMRYVAFAMVCGVAGFGPFTDITILTIGPTLGLYVLFGSISSVVLSTGLVAHFRRILQTAPIII